MLSRTNPVMLYGRLGTGTHRTSPALTLSKEVVAVRSPRLLTRSDSRMPSRRPSIRRALLWTTLGLLLGGCRGEPERAPIPANEQGLREFAGAYRDYFRKNKRGAKSFVELQGKGRQQQSYPTAIGMIKSGELIVRWGTPLTSEGDHTDAVLAYLKDAPEQGGLVLLADGQTIRTMTADEVKVAAGR